MVDDDELRHQYYLSRATKRLKRDLKLILTDPIPDIDVAPNEDDILDWHFAIHGKNDTPYENGVYHGKLMFPPNFPYGPPKILFLTPNGRFEVNKRICFSLSDFHPEEWKPAYSVTAVLRGVYDFMHESTETIGSINTSVSGRRQLALNSREYNLKSDSFRRLFPNLLQGDTEIDIGSDNQDDPIQGKNEIEPNEIPGRIEMNITLQTYATADITNYSTSPITDPSTKTLRNETAGTFDFHSPSLQNQDILETINPTFPNSNQNPRTEDDNRIIYPQENEIPSPPANTNINIPTPEDGIKFINIFPPPNNSGQTSTIEFQARQTPPPINEPNSPTQDQVNTLNSQISNDMEEHPIHSERCNSPSLNYVSPIIDENIPADNIDVIDNKTPILTYTELNENKPNDHPTQPLATIPIPPPEMPCNNTDTLREDNNADLNSSLTPTLSRSSICTPVPQPPINIPVQEPLHLLGSKPICQTPPFKISPIPQTYTGYTIHSSLSRESIPKYNQPPAYKIRQFSHNQISDTPKQLISSMNYGIDNSQDSNAVVLPDRCRQNIARIQGSSIIPVMYRTQTKIDLRDLEEGILLQKRSYKSPGINPSEINCYYIALLVIVILFAISLLYLLAILTISFN